MSIPTDGRRVWFLRKRVVIPVVCLVCLCGYVGSVGPVAMIARNYPGQLPEGTVAVLDVVYAPLLWWFENEAPGWELLDWYVEFWVNDVARWVGLD